MLRCWCWLLLLPKTNQCLLRIKNRIYCDVFHVCSSLDCHATCRASWTIFRTFCLCLIMMRVCRTHRRITAHRNTKIRRKNVKRKLITAIFSNGNNNDKNETKSSHRFRRIIFRVKLHFMFTVTSMEMGMEMKLYSLEIALDTRSLRW